MPYPNIILLGDSLTEQSFSLAQHGSSILLQNAYTRKADVLNRGLSGYSSNWLLPVYERLILAQKEPVLLWIIMLGTNDAILPGNAHHVPIPQLKENIKSLVKTIRANEITCDDSIMLITPPPIDPELLKEKGPRGGVDRRAEVQEEYAKAVREVGWDLGCSLLNFYENLSYEAEKEGGLRGFMTDGLHLGKKGYKVLFDGIMETIGEDFSDIAPRRMPLMEPWWGNLKQVKEWKEGGIKHDEL